MERNKVKELSTRLSEFMQDFARVNNLRFIRSNASYTDSGFRFTGEFLDEKIKTKEFPLKMTDALLHEGLGTIGSEVWVRWSDGLYYQGTILKRLRTKYLMSFPDEGDRLFKVPFRNCCLEV